MPPTTGAHALVKLIFFVGKSVPVFAPGQRLRRRSMVFFACACFVGKSIQCSVGSVFIRTKPARVKAMRGKTCDGRPKRTES
ncbi:MAG: hypothetical protein D6714_04785, partial [Bacteroidetes bacterium]